MNYGERFNYQLFIFMGFCIDDNQGFVPLKVTCVFILVINAKRWTRKKVGNGQGV
jgi:hypothetical protein